jgi:predicted Fe-Mo cluster-binding NifX family protein
MKLAIASDDQKNIAHHFGRALGFMIFDIQDSKVKGEEYRENIGKSNGTCGSCNHSAMINNIKDCQTVISFGMGQHIFDDLKENKITAIVAEEKTVKDALAKFLSNELENRIEKLH